MFENMFNKVPDEKWAIVQKLSTREREREDCSEFKCLTGKLNHWTWFGFQFLQLSLSVFALREYKASAYCFVSNKQTSAAVFRHTIP